MNTDNNNNGRNYSDDKDEIIKKQYDEEKRLEQIVLEGKHTGKSKELYYKTMEDIKKFGRGNADKYFSSDKILPSSDIDKLFESDYVLVKNISNSFENAISKNKSNINLEEAKKEHKSYIEALKLVVPNVIELKANDDLPDSSFIEDNLVIIGKTALFTKPVEHTRANEPKVLKQELENNTTFKKLNYNLLNVEDIANELKLEEDVYLDGGDVVFTGNEILVGVGQRTTRNAAYVLEEAFNRDFMFNRIPVTTIELPSDALHLKSFVTLNNVGNLLIENSDHGEFIEEQIETVSNFEYNFEKAVHPNVIYANTKRIGHENVSIPNINAAGGLLTCSSVILPKYDRVDSILEKHETVGEVVNQWEKL